jgi:hypothetical protein
MGKDEAAPKMKRKDYEMELRKLQVQLCHLQEWVIMADSEPAKKRSPQKCSNCGGEGHTARTCTKGGPTNGRNDTLPPRVL